MSLGFHIHKEGRSFIEATEEELKRAKQHGIDMKSFQIFAAGPRNSKINVTKEDAAYFKSLSEKGYRIIVHGSYLDHPWGAKAAYAIHIIKSEFKVCEEMGAYGMIIHLPKEPVDSVVEVINNLVTFKPKNLILYLEVGSINGGPNTYETPHKIKQLFDKLTSDSVGFCVDTAHLWSSGVDISSRKKAQEWIDEFKKIGIKHVTIAINDQTTILGSGKDVHAPLTYGHMFGKYNPNDGSEPLSHSGIAAMLEWAVQDDIPVILERHDDRPKFHGKPEINNIDSDLMIIRSMGFFKSKTDGIII